MNDIYELETIDQLKDYINAVSIDKLRPLLLTEFNKLVKYRNIKEWNELVRTCEALSITGWGDNEPFEATADKWINGEFYTELRNKFFEQKLEWCRQWCKQKETFVIYETDADKTDYKISKFASQRNKLPKSPIRWTRSGNYQSSVQPLVDSLEILKDKIVRQTRPELYGDTFSYIGIKLNFSHHDDESPSVRNEYFHDENDVPPDFKGAKNPGGMPAYYIRPRFDIGKLSTKNNELRLIITRHFTKAFGFLDLPEQKKILKQDFLDIIDILAEKLKKKKIKYDPELLKQDIIKIFADW
jgi:hypothetical protein